MENNEIYLSIFINRKNTHIQISEDLINYETIDASLGYGKKYYPSISHFSLSNKEFLFGESAINNDVYEDTYVFSSIIDIVSIDDDIIEIGDFYIDKKNVLSLFLDDIINIVTNINPNFIIKNISISYEKVFGKNIDSLFISALEKYTSKISFFEIEQSIYNHAILKDGNMSKNTNLIYIFNDKITATSVNELSDNYYEDTSLSKNILIEQNLIDMFHTIYTKKNHIDKIDDNAKWEIYKIYFQNVENILNKFFQNKTSKLYFNFCYPPFEQTITIDMIKDYIGDELDSIKEFVAKFIAEEKSINLYTENNYLDIIMTHLFSEINFIKNNVADAISYCCVNENYIVLKNDDDVKNDIGLFINKNGERSFLKLIKKGDKISTIYDTIYLYYIKKHGDKIDIVKKCDDEYINLTSFYLKETFVLKDLNMISINVDLSTDGVLNITIKNEEDNEIKVVSICGV